MVMAKKQDQLDLEAMKLGFLAMLHQVEIQLSNNQHQAIRAILNDRKIHIKKRLEDLA
jgi:hypothetical protein